jgi:AAA family ATP:ADP antiporter
MFSFLSSTVNYLSSLWSSVCGSESFLSSLVTQFSALSAAQLDLAMVILVLLILPTLALLANFSWGRSTFQKFYGEIEGVELRKFLILAVAFALIIGSYWSMRVVKDGFFNQMVGVDFVPRAKMLSVVMFSVIMFIFSNIVDRFKKHHLFFVVCGVYSLLFFGIATADWLQLPEITLFPFSLIPGRFIGWAYYIGVESLGGILVSAVFWAFVVSTTTTNLAKKGFPIVYIGAQVGTFVGVTFVKQFVHKLGHPATIVCIGLPLLLLPLIIEYLVATTPPELMLSDQGISADGAPEKKSKPGMLEGLRLIASHPYLMGLAVVSTVYEIVGTIVDFQFKKTAAAVYSNEVLTSYLAGFGQALAILSLVFAVLGTSFLVRTLGVRVCLLGYPTVIALCIISIMLKPTIGVFFIAMVAIKGFSYTLNNPIKELLYLPTSKDVKYKAKGFIDGLAGKASKAGGSAITELIRAATGGSREALLNVGGLVSLGIVGAWALVAFGVGKTYHHLVKNNKIIE